MKQSDPPRFHSVSFKRHHLFLLIGIVLAAAVLLSRMTNLGNDAHPDGERALPPRPFLAILAFHRVLPDGLDEYIISPEKLERILRELNRLGYTPVRLKDVEAALHQDGPLPARPALLVFDDAYFDSHAFVLPLLLEYGWTAVFSVPTGLVSDDPDARQAWGSGPRPYSMTWPEIRDLLGHGMEIASHSVRHKNLTRLDADALDRELTDSRNRILPLDPRGADCLVYPGGRQNRNVRRKAKEAGYRLGLLSGGGPVYIDEDVDPMALPRIHVPGYRPVARSELRRLSGE